MDFYEKQQRRNNMKQAEEEGRVADSLDVRKELLQEVKDGKMTLDEAKKKLAKIKRNAGKNGKVTRNQAYNGH